MVAAVVAALDLAFGNVKTKGSRSKSVGEISLQKKEIMKRSLPKVEEISWSRLSEDRKKNDPKSTKTQTSIVISIHISIF